VRGETVSIDPMLLESAEKLRQGGTKKSCCSELKRYGKPEIVVTEPQQIRVASKQWVLRIEFARRIRIRSARGIINCSLSTFPKPTS